MTKKTYNAMYMWFFGLFMLATAPVYAQQDTTVSVRRMKSDTSTKVVERAVDTLQQQVDPVPIGVDLKLSALQGRVIVLAQQIDSVRINMDSLRTFSSQADSALKPSTTFLNEKVRDISVIKRDINVYREDLKRQNLSYNDTLRNLKLSIEDSLMRLDFRLDGLLENVVQIRHQSTVPVVVDTLAQDSSYSATLEMPSKNHVIKSIRNNLDSDKPLEQFFDYSAWSSRILLVVMALAYFYWTFRLAKVDKEVNLRWGVMGQFQIWIPLAKSIVFFLILLPLTAYVIPIIVLQVSYLMISLLLYALHYREFESEQKKVIYTVFGIFFLLIVANLIISAALWIRLAAGVLNALGLLVAWRVGQATKVEDGASYMRPVAKWAILFGFTVSIISNVFGYVYLARISSIAASVGLIQAVALRAFSTMLSTDLTLHYNKVAKENLIRRFDLQRMLSSLNRLISLVYIIIIGIVLINNLNITTRTANFFQTVLYKEHSLGSITFNYANLLLAILVLWGANWLQSNLKHLLNDPSSDDLQMKRMTLFPLFRLILAVISFFFAISILGLGLEKLTVIVGALTVGIGFGLQNIINNLVSGVILVFEKPFKIGDYIELGDKKGQVLEIGIRSSVLLTDQGAKVIIPNADLFSGRLVNWTFSSTDIRVNIELSVTGSTDIEDVKERLRTRLKNDRYVDKSIPIKVYTKDIQLDTYKISVQVGVKNVRQIERFRSQFLEGLKQELNTLDVSVASV